MSLFDTVPEDQIFANRPVLKSTRKPIGKPINQKSVRSALGSMTFLLKNGKTPPVYYLTGPAGSGKTHLTQYCVEDKDTLNDSADDLSAVWIRQVDETSDTNLLRCLCNQFDDQLPSPSNADSLTCSRSAAVVRERIRRRLETLSIPVVVIFDEFSLTDAVQGLLEEVLLPLWRDATDVAVGLVFLSYKSQYEDLAECFDESGPVHIELDRYSCSEMVEILSQKATVAFQPEVVSENILELCAKISVERKAPPREAQQLLYWAGAAASCVGESTISDRHVQTGVAEMEASTWS